MILVINRLNTPGQWNGESSRYLLFMGLTENGEYIWDLPPVENVVIGDYENTIPKALNHYVKRYSTCHFYGVREFRQDGTRGPYEWMSFIDVVRASSELAEGIKALGIASRSHVAICSQNRVEWQIADFACHAANMIVCPFYDVMAVDEFSTVLEIADPELIFVSLDTLPRLHDIISHGSKAPKHIVIMDDRWDDRAFVMSHLPHLAPTWVSTQFKSEEFMDNLYQEMWIPAYEKMREEGKDEPDVDITRILADPEERSAEELEADPECARYRSYAPPSFITERKVKGLERETEEQIANFDSAVSLITDTFSHIREIGRRALSAEARKLDQFPEIQVPEDVTPQTVCSFVFTSGSTGTPKAAQITHIGFIYSAQCLGARGGLSPTQQMWPRHPDDYFISYLPTAHVFARCLAIRSIFCGERVGFFRGSVPELFDDIANVRPTIMACVPRILQRVYDAVMAKVSKMSRPVAALFKHQLKTRIHRFYDLGKEDETFLDRRVLGQVKAQFGGRVRIMYSGSAPTPAEYGQFFQSLVCKNFVEGYASSETSSGGCVQIQGSRKMGHIGVPLGDIECKLVPVPDLGYIPSESPEEPKGELCFRGPNVFAGYYGNPSATAEVLDEDGWFHSGDIGVFVLNPGPAIGTASGRAAGPYIKIIDRKKTVMKLSQGEFVATESVQTALNGARYCGQVYVGGSSFEPYLLGVVCPDESTFISAASKIVDGGKETEVTQEDILRYCKDPRVIALIHREIVAQARKINLKGFEVPKAIVLEPVAWSVENGFATPSMKLRSPLLKKRYAPLFEKVYAELHSRQADGGRTFEPNYDKIAEAVAAVVSSSQNE